MTENYLQSIAGLKIIWCGLFSVLYGYGGIKYKYLRRFGGPALMGIGVIGFSSLGSGFHWWYLAYPVLLASSLHIGYGGEHVLVKIRKRAIYGLAVGISASPLLFPNHLWTLFIFHCLLCVLASVFLGVFNPARNARDEETLVAVCSTVVPLFLI